MLLRYSRDFEKQADLLGAQIMARAGYDPRALARMFETIERESAESGGSGPQWMSSHPDPGNRTQYITKEAEMLTIARAADEASSRRSRRRSPRCRRRSRWGIWRARRAARAARRAQSVGTPGQPVPRPSSQYRDVSGGGVFQAAVPSNWTSLSSNSAIKVVPENGYGQLEGQTVFSHGVEFGVAKAGSRDLREATNAWLNAVAQSNPDLRLDGTQQVVRISQRSAIASPLVNPSPLGGRERITVYTTFLADGSLFYFLTIVPENEAAAFQETFQRVGESIRLTEAR